MINTKKFMLVSESSLRPSELQYFAIDQNSGGYGYWSSNISVAKLFDSIDAVNFELDSSCFTQKTEMSDGTIDPPRLIHSGIGLDNNHKAGKLVIKIVSIILDESIVPEKNVVVE